MVSVLRRILVRTFSLMRVLGKIVSSAEISKDDVVIEVGPGIGTLTQALQKRLIRL